ncbi:hypothetical protein [Paractinoplanes deccanensis]|uniref:hypothetical protein n=1 Tax=Paractinoplanes deccanensis TaxID=113561 RepID=UPI001940A5C2|nr:hypothetical protein [Actinoplanes deccanensis]
MRGRGLFLVLVAAVIAAAAAGLASVAANAATGSEVSWWPAWLPSMKEQSLWWLTGSIVAVAGSGVLVWWAQRRYEAGARPGGARLEIAGVRFAASTMPPAEPEEDELLPLRPSPGVRVVTVDVRVVNSGTVTAVLNGIDLTIAESFRYTPHEFVLSYTAGAVLRSSATYPVTLPPPRDGEQRVSRAVALAVEPAGADRFEVQLIDPPSWSWRSTTFYRIAMSLSYNNGAAVDVGDPFVVVFRALPDIEDPAGLVSLIGKFAQRVVVNRSLVEMRYGREFDWPACTAKHHPHDVHGMTEDFWEPRTAVATFLDERASDLSKMRAILTSAPKTVQLLPPDRGTADGDLEESRSVLLPGDVVRDFVARIDEVLDALPKVRAEAERLMDAKCL